MHRGAMHKQYKYVSLRLLGVTEHADVALLHDTN